MTSAGAYFTLYVGLWTSQTLLVTMAVQPNGSYLFDFATVCLLVELLKFVGAVGAVSLGGDGGNASGRLARVRRLIGSAPNALPFAIPSILYTAFNLLQFVNLALVPAPTFRTVINIKILFTALFSSCAFGVRLRAAQWGALALLVFGCAVAQLDDSFEFISAGPFALICLQGSLSSVAAVYSHLLLDSTPGSGKGSAGAQGFWARSAWLYAWGALTNLLFLRTRTRDIGLRARASSSAPSALARLLLTSRACHALSPLPPLVPHPASRTLQSFSSRRCSRAAPPSSPATRRSLCASSQTARSPASPRPCCCACSPRSQRSLRTPRRSSRLRWPHARFSRRR